MNSIPQNSTIKMMLLQGSASIPISVTACIWKKSAENFKRFGSIIGFLMIYLNRYMSILGIVIELGITRIMGTGMDMQMGTNKIKRRNWNQVSQIKVLLLVWAQQISLCPNIKLRPKINQIVTTSMLIIKMARRSLWKYSQSIWRR